MSTSSGSFLPLLEILQNGGTPHHFAVWDYRKQPKRALDLVVDADTVYQYLRLQNIPSENLHAFGWSLGGAVVSHLKAIRPNWNGRVIIDRSFHSIAGVVSHLFHRIVGKLLSSLVRWIGWDLASRAQEIPDADKMILWHPHDEIIPNEASASLESGSSYKLRGDWSSPHMDPLEEMRIVGNFRNQTALQAVRCFLGFGERPLIRQGPLIA